MSTTSASSPIQDDEEDWDKDLPDFSVKLSQANVIKAPLVNKVRMENNLLD
jgi:hypothetical protein